MNRIITPAAERATGASPIDGGQDPRAILFGRFMMPDSSEHPCQVAQVSPDGAVFRTSTTPQAGTDIVAYIDEIGRVEAVTGEAVEGGFAVWFRISGARRERIEARIRSLQSTHDDDEAQHRSHPHQDAAGSASHLCLPDGRVYPCEVLDVSISGAAVKIDVIPALGTHVMLGKMRGRVARFLDYGIAIEFNRQVDSTATVPPQLR
jgi:hypothetical protein